MDILVQRLEADVQNEMGLEDHAEKKLETLKSLQVPNLVKVGTRVELEEPPEHQQFELGKPIGTIDYFWK